MKKILSATILMLLLALLTSCLNYEENAIPDLPNAHISISTHTHEYGSPKLEVGDIINFGNYNWRVLEIYENNTALIIAENIVCMRAFHNKWEDVTWEESDLRSYLNSIFLHTFTQEEQSRILLSVIQTLDNAWFRIRGGNDTTDYIFLLSIEEVVRYLGNSSQLMNLSLPQYGIRQTELSDQYNSVRIAFDENGTAVWWYLRSSGFDYDAIAFVNIDGSINFSGGLVGGDGSGGVRPALLLNLSGDE